jgi:hypothetical protein
MIMFSLFSSDASANQVRSAYSLNRQANQVAQTNPALAAELRMRAHATYQSTSIAFIFGAKKKTAKLGRSVSALNSKANRIAQSKPELAIQLRMQAAYA